MIVPPDLSPEDLTPHQERLQTALDQVTRVAEHWADTGRLLIHQSAPRVVQHPSRVLEDEGVFRGGRV